MDTTEPITLSKIASELTDLRAFLEAHEDAAETESARLRREISAREVTMAQAAAGLDVRKIHVARSVLEIRGSYENGGADRASVIRDAIAELVQPGSTRCSLRAHFLGTKKYDRWRGQRSDHRHGYGPTHGSIVFAVGMKPEARDRDLTTDETESAVYFLNSIERIESIVLAGGA